MDILYTSSAVRDAIHGLMVDIFPRRVVLCAYVGQNAAQYLPNATGIQLVCSLTPGATSAQALIALRGKGVRIFKSARLHMKVYWSEKHGCVVTSANLSDNGLSGAKGSLKEAGVCLAPGVVDIDVLIGKAEASEITDADLRQLQDATNRLAKLGVPTQDSPQGKPAMTFGQWCQDGYITHPFAFGWWDVPGDSVEEANDRADREYHKKPDQLETVNLRKGQAGPGDWVLKFKSPNCTHLHWMNVDYLCPSRDREYPTQAVQATDTRGLRVPFAFDDRFKKALKATVKAYGDDLAKVKDWTVFLEALKKNYSSERR